MTNEPETSSFPEPKPVTVTPPADESPFSLPPSERARAGDQRPLEHRDRADDSRQLGETFDPDESPFVLPAIEGMPYERGSEEDRAIRQVIEESDAERRSRRAGT